MHAINTEKTTTKKEKPIHFGYNISANSWYAWSQLKANKSKIDEENDEETTAETPKFQYNKVTGGSGKGE